MNHSIIFIATLLAASTLCTASMMPTTEMLGVDGCFPSQVKRVAKFLDDNIFAGRKVRPSIYYHTCSVEISPNDDAHHYITNVRLGSVECSLTFSTGHYDQDMTFHGDHSDAERKMHDCRTRLDAEMPDLKDEEPVIREEDVELPAEIALPSLTEEEVKELKHQLFKKMQEDAKEAGKAVREARAARRAERDVGIGMSDEDYSDALHHLFDAAKEHKANPEDEDYSKDFEALFAIPELTTEEKKKEEELGAFMGHKVDDGSTQTRSDKLTHKEPLMGGMNNCNNATKMHLKSLLINLMNQGVFRGFTVYLENIVECEAQVVAGMNYKVVLSFNNKERCPVSIYEHWNGSVTLKNAMAIAQDRVCAGYLTHATYMHLSGEVEELDGQNGF